MSVYLVSDTHFNHEGIIRHCSRGFASVEDMNEELIAKWNAAVVRESDTVWHLGDFGFSHSQRTPLAEVFHRLRGKKHLVVGNHDEKNPQVLKLPWERVERLFTLKQGAIRAELCHYPLETWKGSWRGALMLHGHCHGSLKRKIAKRFDMGVDALARNGPVLLEDVWEAGLRETFIPVDGHGERGGDL